MLEILSKIPANKLISTLDHDLLRDVTRISGQSISNFNKDNVFCAQMLLASHGESVLESSLVRCLLLETLSNQEIFSLARKYLSSVPTHTNSACTLLAQLSWSEKSLFVYDFAKSFGIPNEYLPIKKNKVETVETIEPVAQYFDLFDFQEELKQNIVDALMHGNNRFMVQMPTGAGKTKTMWEALTSFICAKNIYNKEKSILWLAHTEELCEQAIDTFCDVWKHQGNSIVDLVRMWGGHRVSPFIVYGSAIFCTYQKLHSIFERKTELAEVVKNCVSIIIADEAHKCLAPTYEKSLRQFPDSVSLIGLTATPGRSMDNFIQNERLARLFNKKLLSPDFLGNPITVLRNRGILAEINHEVIETQFNLSPNNDSGDFTTKILNAVARNTQRNRLIISVIQREVKAKNPVLVFACSTLHSRILAAALNFLGISSAYIDCTMRKSLRRKTISSFKDGRMDVLINYGVLSTGFDAPNIKTVIIARPTTSPVLYSQMVGRGMRGIAVGGTKSFNLIDVRDNIQTFGSIENIYNQFEDYWKS